MKRSTKAFLISAAAAGIYGAVNGKGPFNRLRFRDQHEHIANYVETHYPGAFYAPISATEKGWVTVIRRAGMPKIMLYVTCDLNGNYIFSESAVAER